MICQKREGKTAIFLGVNSFLTLFIRAKTTCDKDYKYITSKKRLNVKKMWKRFRTFLKNVKGAISSKTVVLLAVGLLLVGILAPIGLGTIANANTANWDANVVTMFQVVLPILAVIGIALKYIPRGK